MLDDTNDIWALDEVHFQQYGSRCRMWIPPEVSDPVVMHHPSRHKVGYFGAVRLRDGRFLFQRESTVFNAETFFGFLEYLWRHTWRTPRRTIVIADNARFHHAQFHKDWREEHDGRISFEFLPPYSPELNPIERLWKLTRRVCLHNRYFATLEEVMTTVEEQFNLWSPGSETVRRLCAII